jgi:hypothetical protein
MLRGWLAGFTEEAVADNLGMKIEDGTRRPNRNNYQAALS